MEWLDQLSVHEIASIIRQGSEAGDWLLVGAYALSALWLANKSVRVAFSLVRGLVRLPGRLSPAPGDVCAECLRLLANTPVILDRGDSDVKAGPLVVTFHGSKDANVAISLHGGSVERHLNDRDRKKIIAAARDARSRILADEKEKSRQETLYLLQLANKTNEPQANPQTASDPNPTTYTAGGTAGSRQTRMIHGNGQVPQTRK